MFMCYQEYHHPLLGNQFRQLTELVGPNSVRVTGVEEATARLFTAVGMNLHAVLSAPDYYPARQTVVMDQVYERVNEEGNPLPPSVACNSFGYWPYFESFRTFGNIGICC